MRISSGAVHNLPATKHRIQSIWIQLQLLASSKAVLCTRKNIKDGFIFYFSTTKTSSTGSRLGVFYKNRPFIEQAFSIKLFVYLYM